jgi:hypothetical protein
MQGLAATAMVLGRVVRFGEESSEAALASRGNNISCISHMVHWQCLLGAHGLMIRRTRGFGTTGVLAYSWVGLGEEWCSLVSYGRGCGTFYLVVGKSLVESLE